MKLQTSLYDAATGGSGGGNFQLVTRSGSNLFRSVGYYNFQHEGTNANPSVAGSVLNVQCQSASDTRCVSDVALALFNLRNPVTGDYVIPAPRAGLESTLVEAGSARGTGGNPLVRQRNVAPAQFHQNQYTFRFDGQLTRDQRLSITGFFADFPAFDPFPDPSSLASPFTLRRADKNGTLAISDTILLSDRMINEVRVGVFGLNNSRQLDDPFLSMTNASVGVPNPANNFDSSAAATRLGHYVGRPGTAMERFSFGGPNDSFNRRRQRTYTIGDTMTWTSGRHAVRFGGEYRRNQFDTNLPEEQATEFEKFDNFTQLLARSRLRERHAVRGHRQAVPIPGLQRLPRRRLARIDEVHAEPRPV